MAVSTPVKLSTLGYVILYVSDTQKALSFYRDTLGMKVKLSEGGWVELDSGATTLALHHHDKLPAQRSEGQPIVVFNVEDIRTTYEALKASGVKFEKEPHEVCAEGDFVGLSADFRDPDGNSLSIYGRVPRK